MSEPAGRPAMTQRKQNLLFWLKLTNGSDFLIPHMFCSLHSWVLLLSTSMNGAAFFIRTFGFTSYNKAQTSPANFLACKGTKTVRLGFVPWKKHAVWSETCQDQWRDPTFFRSLSLSHQPGPVGSGTYLRQCVEGGRKGLFSKIILCLKKS